MGIATYTDLQGRIAVVTGGSRGIGAATARALAHNGAKVAVVGRDQDALDGVVAAIRAEGGTAIPAVADVTSEEQLAQVRELVERELGAPTLLAAFAGGMGAPQPTMDLAAVRWREIIETDLTAAFLTVQAFLPGMAAAGGGSIVTMASSAGRQPSRANAAYAAAKAGVVMFTRHLATELGPQGIRVNCLAPSSIRTEKVVRQMPAEVQRTVAAQHPLSRLGTPEDVAEATLFLCSDASGWLSGLTIDVAGGRITN
ncbi:3-oxoacyl-[acyl-carrier protein] reductase [Streptacidiphilus sp. MAP12-20]|uniref:SDR family NAD(P)-dependent oxidoreductase n=1 Tax=Streptacidiphilus sp. MAP12-20 TaxID=3156299 RepID=UPI003515FF9E